MATGMLVVFAFLAIMVIAMRLMSGILLKLFPEKEVALETASVTQASELELAVAIAAAYMRHK